MKHTCFHKRIIDNIAVAVVSIGLICLFIAANHSIRSLSGELIFAAEGTIDAIFREDWEDAILLMEGSSRRFAEKKERLMLFMNHEAIADLEISLNGSLQLAKAHDDAQILLELESVITKSDALRSVEQLRLFTLF